MVAPLLIDLAFILKQFYLIVNEHCLQ